MWDRMSVVTAVGVAWVVGAAAAAAPVDLTFRAEEGTELRYRTQSTEETTAGMMGQNMEQSRRLEHVAVLRVVERRADGTRLALRYESIKVDAKLPTGSWSVDTSRSEEGGSDSPLQKAARAMLGPEVTFQLTDEGITNLRVPFQAPQGQEAQWVLGPIANEETLRLSLEGLLRVSREKKTIEEGAWWEETEERGIDQLGKMTIVQKFRAVEPRGDVVVLEFDADLSLSDTPPGMTVSIKEGDVTGKIHWDAQRGLVRVLDGKSVMDITVDVGGGMTMTSATRSTSKTELVEGSEK